MAGAHVVASRRSQIRNASTCCEDGFETGNALAIRGDEMYANNQNHCRSQLLKPILYFLKATQTQITDFKKTKCFLMSLDTKNNVTVS